MKSYLNFSKYKYTRRFLYTILLWGMELTFVVCLGNGCVFFLFISPNKYEVAGLFPTFTPNVSHLSFLTDAMVLFFLFPENHNFEQRNKTKCSLYNNFLKIIGFFSLHLCLPLFSSPSPSLSLSFLPLLSFCKSEYCE